MNGDPNFRDQVTESAEVLERNALTSTLNSFLVYGKAAHANLTRPRFKAFYSLSPAHQGLLQPSYTEHLDQIDKAIDSNASFLRLVAQYGANEFEAPQDMREWEGATAFQVDQTRSTIKQIYRDWSSEAASERDICYGRVIRALNNIYDPGNRASTKVLIPGAGLGRLAYDVACEGYVSQGNEFSYHMLIVSNFILNLTTKVDEFAIYPFIHTFSHTSTASNQVRQVTIPDRCPSTSGSETGGNFSFTAGSFTDIYGRPDAGPEDKWDAILTVFFLDTAHNVLDYIDVIRRTLKDVSSSDEDVYWINFGPLLYHFEDEQNLSDIGGAANQDKLSIELPLDILVSMVERCGFSVEVLETGITSTYAADEKAMGKWVFESVFWVARKLPAVA
ncbi:N2227-like protein-domain-containing protein [Lipomyces arxii]|uniref:N2227-like protein-domain-containing protein n=1 Tax=Lipomyces arxii TaxID=56418 RepID=UPI0034CD1995